VSEVEAEAKAREAVEHMQKAALEMIAAARAVLDVAEELIRHPEPLIAAANATARAAAEAGAKLGADGGAPPADVPPREPRVQHIRVS
jgi:hypothetical protein